MSLYNDLSNDLEKAILKRIDLQISLREQVQVIFNELIAKLGVAYDDDIISVIQADKYGDEVECDIEQLLLNENNRIDFAFLIKFYAVINGEPKSLGSIANLTIRIEEYNFIVDFTEGGEYNISVHPSFAKEYPILINDICKYLGKEVSCAFVI